MAGQQGRLGYTILCERQDGAWEVAKESDEGTQIGALNAALNGAEPRGRWIAIPRKYWQPRELQPKTIYDWVELAE